MSASLKRAATELDDEEEDGDVSDASLESCKRIRLSPRFGGRMTAIRGPPQEVLDEIAAEKKARQDRHLQVLEDLRNVLRVCDNSTMDALRKELEQGDFDWILEPKLHLPRHKDSCRDCENYVGHLKARANVADETYSDEEQEEEGHYGFNNTLMEKLFLLRDLKTREAAFAYNYENPRGIGEFRGLLANAEGERLKMQAERDSLRAEHDTLVLRSSQDAASARQENDRLKRQILEFRDRQTRLFAQLQRALQVNAQNQGRLLFLDKVCFDRDQIFNEHARTAVAAENSIKDLRCKNEDLETRLEACKGEILILQEKLNPNPTSALPFPVSAGDWLTMKMPGRDAPPELLAQWLQFHEHTNIHGLPISPPEFTVDLRLVRGYREVMFRSPGKTDHALQGERKARKRVIRAIVELLAVPGKYTTLVEQLGLRVSRVVTYTPLVLDEGYQETFVARLLAVQGLAIPVADDAWKFCHEFLKSDGGAPDVLRLINSRLAAAPAPPGLRSTQDDQFRRPADLPRIRKK